MQQRALEVVGASKRYGGRTAVDSVDLFVDCGTVHGLLGPNGAGKTTLMRIMLGLVRRDGGDVHLLGRELEARGGRVPAGVAGVVDAPAFYPYLSGRRNLLLLADLDDVHTSTGSDRVDAVLREVGLASQADVEVRGYSSGMRQRLGLAAARLRAPQLLFLDEPTSSLDPDSAQHVHELIVRMADEGAAVVISSHDMTEVEQLCSTITVLRAGRVAFSGSVSELRERTSATIHALRTSNDAAAAALAIGRDGLRLFQPAGEALELTGDVAVLDAYVIALGRAGVAVRSLEVRARSLESLFLDLTRNTAAPLLWQAPPGIGEESHDQEPVAS